jgi:hypothetical protein
MRASHLALIVGVLALPSAANSQDSGQAAGVLSTSPMQPSPSMGSTGAYPHPPEPGPRAGFAGAVMPGHVVQESMPGSTRARHRYRRWPPGISQPELDTYPAGSPRN